MQEDSLTLTLTLTLTLHTQLGGAGVQLAALAQLSRLISQLVCKQGLTEDRIQYNYILFYNLSFNVLCQNIAACLAPLCV